MATATTLNELVDAVTQATLGGPGGGLGISVDGVAAVTALAEVPAKGKIVLVQAPAAAAAAPYAAPREFSLMLVACELNPENKRMSAWASHVDELGAAVRNELQLGFDVDLMVSSAGGFAPLLSLDGAAAKLKIAVRRKAAAAARDFVLLVSSTDGLVTAPRRCTVTAASAEELATELARQLEVPGPITVSYDGVPLADLASLPAKTKVTVAAGFSEGVPPPAGQQFHLIVSSALFDGQRVIEIYAADATDLCFKVQSALGLSVQVDVFYLDVDFNQAVYIVELEDLLGVTEVQVAPAKRQRVKAAAGPLAAASVKSGDPPSAPGAPTLAAPAADTLEIEWSTVPGVLGYNVEKRFAFDEDGWERIPMRIKGTSACLDGFGPVTSHVFRVVAINAFGESKPGPDSAEFQTKPGVPDTPAAAQVTSSTWSDIALTWEPPKDNGAPVESFTVQQRLADSDNWAVIGTTAANAIAAGKLEPATSYVFRVIAMNTVGASMPGRDTEQITTAPGPPGPAGMPRAVGVTPNSLSIEWDQAEDHGEAIQNYSVEYCTASSEWAKAGDTGAMTSYTANDLRPLASYAFRVTASNSVGAGVVGPASQSIATEAAAPAKPTGPQMAAVTASSLTVEWVAPDDNNTAITGYRVERRDPGSAEWNVVSSFQARTDLSCGDLKPASSYMFRVTAVSAAGESEVGDESERMQTRAAVPSRPFPAMLSSLPSSSALSIEWAEPNDNGSPITSYRCELQMDGAGWGVVYEGAHLNAKAEGLSPATEYLVRVTAANAEGDSSRGEEAVFKTAAERPSAPQPPILAANSGSEMTLTWEEPACNGARITHYEVQRQVEGGAGWTAVASGVGGTVAAVPKGDQEETVFFRVSATNEAGTSDFSAASQPIRSEAAMRKLMLLVTSDTLFTEKKKVAVEAGSIDHLSMTLQNKLGLAEPIQVLSDTGVLFSSLDQIGDKAKVAVRSLHALTPAPADTAGKRNFTLLITSTFFADKRRAQVSAGSVAELTSALQASLGLSQPFAIVIHDEDFDEDRMIADLEDIETDKAKIQLVEL